MSATEESGRHSGLTSSDEKLRHDSSYEHNQQSQRAEAALLEREDACHSWEAQLAKEHHELDEQWERDHHDRERLWESVEQERQKLEQLRDELASWEKEHDCQKCLTEAVEAALCGSETVLLGQEEACCGLEA